MKSKIIVWILLVFFCLSSFSYGYANESLYSSLVAKTIGYQIGHEKYKSISYITIDMGSVQTKTSNYIKDRGFKLKTSIVLSDRKIGKTHYVEGLTIHTDPFTRAIETKFKAMYVIKHKNFIVVKRLNLQNFSKPRSLFFIVPTKKIAVSELKKLPFSRAIRRVSAVARKLNSFNIGIDTQPQNYKLILFIMTKINKNEQVNSVFSSTPFGQQGKIGENIKTKDGWEVIVTEVKFPYNGNVPKYISLLWKKGDYTMPLESYSTQSLIKSIQIAMQSKGYDIGRIDGKLNKKTEKEIRKYLITSGFDYRSRLSESLLWFMKHYHKKNVSKIVQSALLLNGIRVGSIDGKIGPNTIKGVKKYQRKFGLNGNGRITPELVYTLIQTSKNVAIYSCLRDYFDKPIALDNFRDKMWPNEL